MLFPLAGAVALGAAGAGFLAWQYTARPAVGHVGALAFASAAPTIIVPATNASSYSGVKASVDGADVSRSVRATSRGLELRGIKFADGVHRVQLAAHPSGMFGSSLAVSVPVTIDTVKPQLTLREPPAGWNRTLELTGTAEKGAVVEASWPGGSKRFVAGDGEFELVPDLKPGAVSVQVVARDLAGNESVLTRTVHVDSVAPQLSLDKIPAVVGSDSPTVRASLKDETAMTLEATIDGLPIVARSAGGAPLTGTARTGRIALPLQRLTQGIHRVKIVARDAAGNTKTVESKPFTVDSQERLHPGTTLALGARGKDVVQLERRMKDFKVWKGPFTRFYNERTVAAVRAFQKLRELPLTGMATPAVLAASNGHIVVRLSKFRMWLIRDGKKVFSAPIATGQPAYPTPTGQYEITDMAKNPSWIPPNSPWAKGLEPIPPGASNPLGTRWIGTSAPAIGFHATPQEWSVGHAASHGCMRMKRVDVERLYALVRIGMPVDIEA